MANLEATATLVDTGDSVRVTSKATVTTTGESIDRRRMSIGTGEETITIASDITGGNGPGWCWIKNEDSTNYVEVARTTTDYFAKLLAGDAMLIPLEPAMTQLFMKAHTGACNVTMDIRER